MRSTRLAVALLFALAACDGTSPPGADNPNATRYGEGLQPSDGAAPTRPAPRSPPGTPQRPAGGAPSTTGAIPGGRTGGGSAPYFDDAGVGAMARRYLQPAPATSLYVEIDYMEGRRPSAQAISHVREILLRETRKRVTIVVDDMLEGPEGSYSFDEIEAFEDRYRDERSGGSRATMWVIYLDGGLRDEPGTVGVATRASTAAIFYDGIRDAGSATIGANQIERAVLTHEIGHLLALVNIGYRSRTDHEDPRSPGHSRSRGSVMYAQIENKGLVALITGGPADDFDDDDRADLEMLRSGAV